ncbi:MAG: TonB-dependent receptor [Alphaproteobacteria bacterium]|nr:TonB-dependent receptor [Alphaproteobacteria bacterium]
MRFRDFLFGSAGAILASAPAFAQAADPAAAPDPAGDVVVVTGSALIRREAIEQKKDDTRVIEALGSDELGQLPDKNVGESLDRLPGVSMLVEKGEGRFVQIRGVSSDLNNVTINGVQMGSPETQDGGRQAPLDIISGGVLGAVQVIKTPTPDMDAQGIGGTVNIETKMPFDRPDSFYGYASGRYGYEAIRPDSNAYGGFDPYALDGTISGKVGDTFGWLLGASYSAREYVARGVYQDTWSQVDGAPDGTFLPVDVKNNYYTIGRKRLNVNGALQWKPSEGANYFVRGFYGSWDEFQHRNRYEQNLTVTTPGKVTLTSPTTGTQGTDRVLANIRHQNNDKTIGSIAAGGDNTFGNIKVDYLVQANHNDVDTPNDNWEWRSSTSAVGPSTFVVDGDGVVTITPDAGTPDRTDPSLFPLRRARFHKETMDEDAIIGQVNLRWDMNDMIYFKAGLKGSKTDRSKNISEVEYDPLGTPITLATDPSFTSGGFANETGHKGGAAPNIWMNYRAMDAYLRDPANAAHFQINAASTLTSEYASDYDLTETIYAGYGMGVGQFGPVQVIGGVRVESTKVDSSGYLLDGSSAPPRINAGGDYTEVLPALLVNYRPTQAWAIRGAVTRALGRPDYDQIAPRSTYSENGATGSVSIGNPDLVARKSWNYDASVEFYPNQLTVLSAAVFYKDISDQLVGQADSYTTQTDMQARLAQLGLTGIDTSALTVLNVSTTVNATSATLKGLELTAQTQFSFLPAPFDGLGVSAAATFVDGESKLIGGGTEPLTGQPKRTYSLTGFYQKGPIDASISYSYNASYLTDNNSDPTQRLDQGEFGRLDAKVSYSLNNHLKIFLEGVNLNDEPTTEFQGGVERRNTEYEYVGRSVYLGASWGF